MLILGCGNPDRADDAAGLLVARRLRKLGIQTRELGGEALELLDAWSEEPDVLIVDAVKTGAPPGTITVWDARTSPLPACQFRCSTHALGVAEGIELARALDRLPGKLTVVGIEGHRFDQGAPPSAEVAQAVERLAQHLTHLSPSNNDFGSSDCRMILPRIHVFENPTNLRARKNPESTQPAPQPE